jgi:hypothetical protein
MFVNKRWIIFPVGRYMSVTLCARNVIVDRFSYPCSVCRQYSTHRIQEAFDAHSVHSELGAQQMRKQTLWNSTVEPCTHECKRRRFVHTTAAFVGRNKVIFPHRVHCSIPFEGARSTIRLVGSIALLFKHLFQALHCLLCFHRRADEIKVTRLKVVFHGNERICSRWERWHFTDPRRHFNTRVMKYHSHAFKTLCPAGCTQKRLSQS